MEHTYWQRQGSEPLFPDLIWARPENKLHAGKLLIIGGNAHGLASIAESYALAEKHGIGTCRVVLPDAIHASMRQIIHAGVFAPSTPSGSFSVKALGTLLDEAAWADGVLLPGDLGRNSETAILLEKFVNKYTGALVVTKDAADYFKTNAAALLQRPNTTLVVSLAQLQKLATDAKYTVPLQYSLGLLNIVEWLHNFTSQFSVAIVMNHQSTTYVAHSGTVSTTPQEFADKAWRLPLATTVAVWKIQNPSKTFEALTTAVAEI